MACYKMRYDINVLSISSSNSSVLTPVRLTNKGVRINKSNKNYSNTCSIFIPKRNPIKNINNEANHIFTDWTSLLFKKGDRVSVKMWYDVESSDIEDNIIHVFTINEIVINEHDIELRCLDYSYYLMNTKISGSWDNINIVELIDIFIAELNNTIGSENERFFMTNGSRRYLIDKFDYLLTFNEVVNLTGVNTTLSFKADNTNIMDCLKEIEKKILLVSNFLPSEQDKSNGLNTFSGLCCGSNIKIGEDLSIFAGLDSNVKVVENQKWYFSDLPNNHLRKLNKNFKYTKIISRNNLKRQNETDLNFQIVCKIFDSEGYSVEFKSLLGSATGDTRTFIFIDNTKSFKNGIGGANIDDYKLLIENEVKKYKYTGFKPGSSFTTFGFIKCSEKDGYKYLVPNPYDLAILNGIGNLRPNSNMSNDINNVAVFTPMETYMIDSVEVRFDSNGFRQEIELSYFVPPIVSDMENLITVTSPTTVQPIDTTNVKVNFPTPTIQQNLYKEGGYNNDPTYKEIKTNSKTLIIFDTKKVEDSITILNDKKINETFINKNNDTR